MSDKILGELKNRVQDTTPTKPIVFHMHASRQGPAVSNEVMLSIKEYERNNKLKKIIGIQQPGGTVSKYLFYWLSGLSASVVKKIYSRAEIDGTSIKTLTIDAKKHEIESDKFLYAFIQPIYDHYQDRFNEVDLFYDEIAIIDSAGIGQNLADLMTFYSVAILNLVFSKKGLPVIEIQTIDDYPDISIPNLRFADYSMLKNFAIKSVTSKKRQKTHAIDFIKKRFIFVHKDTKR